jgi:predicted component of type VI protein secretion system
MGMQSFERALENMVASVFSRSRSTIRPVELGRRLLREMDDHRSVDVKGRRIVPNHFTFHLSPRDHAGFADIDNALREELCTAAIEYAQDENYHFVGPVSVALVVDQALKPGRIGIASQLSEDANPGAELAAAAQPAVDEPSVWSPAPISMNPIADVPQPAAAAPAPGPALAPLLIPSVVQAEPVGVVIDPASAPAAPARRTGHLLLPSGERVVVGTDVVSIGRLPECTITLTDPNVSRRHAEVRPGTQITVVDLGSTNGTKVNGLRITGERPLVDGDIVSLGSTHLRFEATSPSA